mmetsp:Transcript_41310/g.66470  ORF Transcript_41310/g.66470 Transcript_41310/m.66470 type:complete len:494 (-) Transcript_41310:34-1515(-)
MEDHKSQGEDGGPKTEIGALSYYIYATEFISAFGDRMWQFAIPILFLDVWADSLLPTILYTFIINLATFLLMPICGSYVDTAPRLSLMMLTIFGDNVAVFVSCGLLYCTTYVEDNDDLLWMMFYGILAVCVPGQLMVNVGTIALEKDWVPIMTEKEPHALATLSSRLRMIDLSCKFLGPTAFALFLQFLGGDSETRIRWGCGIVIGYNILTVLPECVCVLLVYRATPRLASAKCSSESAKKHASKNAFVELFNGWNTYVKHPMFLASFSFTLLYATVLSPGSLLIAFLKWIGVMDGLLGMSVGMGAIFGMLGTYLFPLMHRRTATREHFMSLEQIGMLSVWMWFAFIAPIAICILLREDHWLTLPSMATGHLILFFVVTGRTWLWVFDLAENQLVVERVTERIDGKEIIGQFMGVQRALTNLFTVVIYMLGLIFHRPNQFYILCYASVFFVLLSAIGYTIWFVRYGDARKYEERIPIYQVINVKEGSSNGKDL